MKSCQFAITITTTIEIVWKPLLDVTLAEKTPKADVICRKPSCSSSPLVNLLSDWMILVFANFCMICNFSWSIKMIVFNKYFETWSCLSRKNAPCGDFAKQQKSTARQTLFYDTIFLTRWISFLESASSSFLGCNHCAGKYLHTHTYCALVLKVVANPEILLP